MVWERVRGRARHFSEFTVKDIISIAIMQVQRMQACMHKLNYLIRSIERAALERSLISMQFRCSESVYRLAAVVVLAIRLCHRVMGGKLHGASSKWNIKSRKWTTDTVLHGIQKTATCPAKSVRCCLSINKRMKIIFAQRIFITTAH